MSNPSDSPGTPPPNTGPAAGWYQQPGTHEMRYWDGENWTSHVAPNPASSRADKDEAAWPYWGALIFGFFPALILFFAKKDQPRTRSNSAQVLNIEIVVFAVQMAAMFIGFAGFGATIAAIDENPAETLSFFGLFFLVSGVSMALLFAKFCLYLWLGIAASKGVDKSLRFAPKLIKP